MFGIGLGEILLLILIIFLISPKDLPKAMKKAAQFFVALSKIKKDIANINEDVNDIIKDADIKDELLIDKKGKKNKKEI